MINFLSKLLNRLIPSPPPKLWKLPGHYYSPNPGDADIAVMKKKLSAKVPESIPGINLNHDGKKKLLAEKMPLCLKNTGGSIWLRKEC